MRLKNPLLHCGQMSEQFSGASKHPTLSPPQYCHAPLPQGGLCECEPQQDNSNLSSPIEVLDQVFSRRKALNNLSLEHEQDLTGIVSSRRRRARMFGSEFLSILLEQLPHQLLAPYASLLKLSAFSCPVPAASLSGDVKSCSNTCLILLSSSSVSTCTLADRR